MTSAGRRCGWPRVAALRDTVVLGRAGECGGPRQHVGVAGDDGVVLHDELRLDLATSRQDAYVALAAGHRVARTLCLLGAKAAPESPFALARGGRNHPAQDSAPTVCHVRRMRPVEPICALI